MPQPEHSISVECERRIGRTENTLYEPSTGIVGAIGELRKIVKKLEDRYNFGLGGLSMFNFILGLVIAYNQVKH